MLLSKRKFITGLAGLVAAPAVVRADNLMKVHTIPERYATVWGVGWDLEVVEYPVWSLKEALGFAKFDGGGIDKFREITEIVYANPALNLPIPEHHYDKRQPNEIAEWFAKERELTNMSLEYLPTQGLEELREENNKKMEKMFESTKHLNIKGDPRDNFDHMLTPSNSTSKQRIVTVFDDPKQKPSLIRRWDSSDMSRNTWEEAGIWI